MQQFLTPKQALKIIWNIEYLHDGFRRKYPAGGPTTSELFKHFIEYVIHVHVDIATRAMFWICFFLCLDFFSVFALDRKEQIALLQMQDAFWIASQFERVCDRCTWNDERKVPGTFGVDIYLIPNMFLWY